MDKQLLKLVSKLADAREQRRRWEELERTYLEALLDGHKAGEVPTAFTAAGLTFKLQLGRSTVVYPDTVTAEIKLVQAKAVEAGLTTTKQGEQFWRISTVKQD